MANIVARPLLISTLTTLSDINSAFDGFNGITSKDVELVEGEILNVMSTSIGEEWEEPTYGSRIPTRLFDPITQQTAWLLEHDLDDACRLWVPQIKVDLTNTRAIPYPDQRFYVFNIVYTLTVYNIRRQYPVLLGPYTSR